MYCGGQLRDISEVSEVGVKTIQQFRHLSPFTHPLSFSPSVDHGSCKVSEGGLYRAKRVLRFMYSD